MPASAVLHPFVGAALPGPALDPYALPGGSPHEPDRVRIGQGAAFEFEVRMPPETAFAGIPSEAVAGREDADITAPGGWCAYLAAAGSPTAAGRR